MLHVRMDVSTRLVKKHLEMCSIQSQKNTRLLLCSEPDCNYSDQEKRKLEEDFEANMATLSKELFDINLKQGGTSALISAQSDELKRLGCERDKLIEDNNE